MTGVILARFDQLPWKAEGVRPLQQEGRSTSGRVFFSLLFLVFAVSLFTDLAHGKQTNATTAKVVGTVFVQDSAGNRSVVAGARVKLDGSATFETLTDENGNYLIP